MSLFGNYASVMSIDIFFSMYQLPITMTDFRFREKLISGMHILHGLIHTARTGSVYVTMSITFERYLAMVTPFKRINVKKFLLPFAITFAILYNFPKVN